MSRLRENLTFFALSAFFVLALFNPVFKKYDYGAGFPLIILLAGLALFLVIVEFKKKREKVRFEPMFLVIFGVAMVLSFVFSQTKNVGFSEVLAYGSIIPLYLALAYQKHKWIDKFLNVVAISAVLAALMGFYIYFTEGEVRMMGPFFNTLYHAHVWPNAFALFLLLSWPSFLKGWNWLRAIGLGIVLSALLLTFSRGALIAFAGQFVLLVFYFVRRLNQKAILGAFLTIVVAGVAYLGANYLRSMNHEVIDVEERINFSNSEGLTSKQERVDFWEGALDLAHDNPWFGYGPFSFRQAYSPIQETFLGNADHPHNVFLKFAAENGLIAVFAFILFLMTVFIVGISRFRGLEKDEKDRLYFMAVAVAGAFAHNLIDYNLNFTVNILLLFVYLALGRSILAHPKKVVKAKLATVIGVIVVLFAFYEGCILVLSETQDDAYLEHSFFPRNYYLNEADAAIADGDYAIADIFLDEQLELNSLDAQAYYLKGVVCGASEMPVNTCLNYYGNALNLDSMNDFDYYAEYFSHLQVVAPDKVESFVEEIVPVVENYFLYVENNVHFTAYTDNVESAARFITLLLPHLEAQKADDFQDKMDHMMETAEKLRLEKAF